MIFRGHPSPTRSQFVTDYWQRRPCLLRRAFPDFVPDLDENDIAGLACDAFAESRLVSGRYPDHDWRITYGPFTAKTLQELPARDWCLLVQDVEKHYPPLTYLMQNFNFLPSWRLDDLMISVAAEGGSVGPHVDRYDVFLLQASGRHRWQIASHFDPACLPDCDLNVLKSFTAEQEWELEPGDVLYLPPGVAHFGVALEQGMTWSVGLRSPSQADLLLALGEWLADRRQEGERFEDSPLPPNPRPGEISSEAIERLNALISHPPVQGNELKAFLAGFLTRFRLAHRPAPPPERVTEAEVAAGLAGGVTLQRNPWTRAAWIELDGMALLSAAGDEYQCSIELAEQLCAIPTRIAGRISNDDATVNLLCRLINDGHFYLEAGPDTDNTGESPV